MSEARLRLSIRRVAVATWPAGAGATRDGCSDDRVSRHALKVGRHLTRGLAAECRIFLERLENDALQLGWDQHLQLRWQERRPIQDPIKNDARSRAGKRRSPGHHLVRDQAERKEIGAGIDRLASDLLRRHVRECAHHLATGRE
jgi:hypothetical protein